jgi:hypothetical protein
MSYVWDKIANGKTWYRATWQEADAKDSGGGEIGRGGLTEAQMNGIVVTVLR